MIKEISYVLKVRLKLDVILKIKFTNLSSQETLNFEAPSHGLPVIEYDKNCTGTLAYQELAKEVLEQYQTEIQLLHNDKK